HRAAPTPGKPAGQELAARDAHSKKAVGRRLRAAWQRHVRGEPALDAARRPAGSHAGAYPAAGAGRPRIVHLAASGSLTAGRRGRHQRRPNAPRAPSITSTPKSARLHKAYSTPSTSTLASMQVA